jgi:hypothetical protein
VNECGAVCSLCCYRQTCCDDEKLVFLFTVQWSLDVNEFHVLWFPILMPWFQPLVTDSKELRWDYVAGKPGHCPAFVLITVSSISQDDNYYDALWDETLLQLFNVLYASKKCLWCTKVRFRALHVLWNFCIFLLLVLHNLLEPNKYCMVKMNATVCDRVYHCELILH